MAHAFFLKRAAAAAALAATALAATPAAHAGLSFVFTDVGTTPMTSQQLAGFQAAGAYWSSQLTDNVTVYLSISMAALDSGILGQTGSTFTTSSYANLRSALVADATSATDASAVASLQAGPALSFHATQGDLTVRLDNDGSTNNRLLGLTTANAKALGMSTGTSAASPDGVMTFSTNFNFDYDRSNGINGGAYDFVTVVEHEIGHALGFVSGVDDIDFCAGPGAGSACNISNTADRFENDWWYEPLDLFRYSAAGAMDVRVGGSAYFSVDGGVTSVARFSTGSAAHGGNGYQASHFGTDAVRLMRPYVDAGNAGTYDAGTTDLMAFDAIGWNLVGAVPEPGSYALLGAGLLAVAGAARRRRSD